MPANPQSTTNYTLSTADVGKTVVYTGFTGSAGVTVPAATFAQGDIVSVYNASNVSMSVITSAITGYLGGTTTTTSPRTLAGRGICTVWFNSASEAVISGAGLS